MKEYEMEQTNDGLLMLRERANRNIIGTFTSPSEMADEIFATFHPERWTEERTYMFALDTKLKPIGGFEISHGTIDATLLDPSQVFKRAMLLNTKSIVIFHNHPSGDATPSNADFEVTERIKELGKLLNIPLLEHMIFAGNRYYSFHEAGKC